MNNIKIPESKFPNINNISDVLPYIKDKKEISVSPKENGTTIVCYNVEDSNTFSDDISKECRGIVFDTDSGDIIGRPLHKFFNLNENEHVQARDLDWNNVVAIWDKIDGSMITAHKVKGTLDFKTKKSFVSDTVLLAKAFLYSKGKNIVDFCEEIADEFTPIFEYTSPENRVVIGFDKDEMTLLHVRHIKSGAYIPFSDPALKELITKYNIKTLTPLKEFNDGHSVNIDRILNFLKDAKDMEGYIIQFPNDMVKIKSDWYRNAHRIVSFLRERDVARMIIDGNIDDAKEIIQNMGYSLDAIEEIEHKIVSALNGIIKEVEDAVSEAKKAELSFKEIAEKYKNNNYFGLIMRKARDLECDYVDYYKKNYLNKFSLNEVKIVKI